ncbi:MAG: PhoH family protein [Bacteroidales bacterium]
MEKRIIIEDCDPRELYGVNNSNLEKIKSYLPSLKITARGSEINISGREEEVKIFINKIKTLIDLTKKKIHLNENDVDKIFENAENITYDNPYTILFGNEGKIITARTVNQKKLVDNYNKNDLVFAVGPAGTGKTYTAIALSVKALKNREIKNIILTRPAVEAGERLGFLPGNLKEKLDPYLQPLYDALKDMIHPKKLEKYMEDGTIQIAPLAYMRGRTLNNAVVILDEAQNTSIGQLKMFLTRMGKNAKFIVTGDSTQIDLPHKNDSGLLKGINIIKDIKGISIVKFGIEDIMRHPLVIKIVKAFEDNQ